MRARICRPLVAVVVAVGVVAALAGCGGAGQQPGAPDGTSDGVSTSDPRANGRVVCQAARKTSDSYLPTILDVGEDELASEARDWAAALSRDARNAHDTSLQTALLSLADVVRGWGTRPPDQVGVRGFQNDLEVACQPYLVDASASA